jgi:hypothetical protein
MSDLFHLCKTESDKVVWLAGFSILEGELFQRNKRSNRENVTRSEEKYQHNPCHAAAGACTVSLVKFREFEFLRSCGFQARSEEEKYSQVRSYVGR